MNKGSGAYDPSICEELDQVDWDHVIPKVLKYAHWRAKKFDWLGIEVDPGDLVQEAIARAYGIGSRGKYRNWNRTKCPDVVVFLKGIIRNMTSRRAEHAADFPKESLHNQDGSLKDNKLFNSADELAGACKLKTPELEFVEAENLRALMDLLDGLEDEDLGMVVLCIREGIGKPKEIARVIGFDVGQVNNILKRLRRKVRRFQQKT